VIVLHARSGCHQVVEVTQHVSRESSPCFVHSLRGTVLDIPNITSLDPAAVENFARRQRVVVIFRQQLQSSDTCLTFRKRTWTAIVNFLQHFLLVEYQAKLYSDALQCYSSRTLVYLHESIDCSFMFLRAAPEDSTALLCNRR
jgi:hypothetical protein